MLATNESTSASPPLRTDARTASPADRSGVAAAGTGPPPLPSPSGGAGTDFDPATARFRAGSAFELVVFDRLEEGERTLFAELAADPAFYGVLRPTAGGGTYQRVDRDLALLLLTLAEPAPLPFFVRRGESSQDLADLVLDGVLEVEHDGRFVAGTEAASLFGAAAVQTGRHPLGRLADRAVRVAARLGSHDAGHLTAFLYGYNRLPLTPDWERRLPDREAVLAFLGFAAGSPERRTLEADWRIAPPSDEQAGWIAFVHAGGAAGAASGRAYKLYVSPQPEDLPAAFAAVADVLRGRPGAAFKVGADAAGVLRPDKLVAYFSDLESLLAVARKVEERLAGASAHGVPFSAPIDIAGLLSWGVDPPSGDRPLSWQGPESWRTWLAGRLGALLARAAGGDPEEARTFALARLARDGVDVERWLPAAGLFRAA